VDKFTTDILAHEHSAWAIFCAAIASNAKEAAATLAGFK
jgi:hypothetical protein